MKKRNITCICLIFLMGVFFPKILFSYSLEAVGSGGEFTKSGQCADGSFVNKINVGNDVYSLPPPDKFHCQGNGISEDVPLSALGNGDVGIRCPENYVATGWKVGEDGGITGIILVCTRFSGNVLYDGDTKENGIYTVIPSDDGAQVKFLRGDIPSTFRTCPTHEALFQINIGYDYYGREGYHLSVLSGECRPFSGNGLPPAAPKKVELTLKNELQEMHIQSDPYSEPCRTECPAGMIIKGLNVRSGSLVDNIGVICVDVNDPSRVIGNTDIPPQGVTLPNKCGGSGGAAYKAICPDGEYVKGFNVRVGAVWEGIRLQCAKINYYADVIQDVFSGESYFQDLEYGVNTPSREANNYPDPPAPSYYPLCRDGTSFPVGLDVWHNKFCWKSRGLIYDTTVCYNDIVRGAKVYCKEAMIEEETQTVIVDLSGFFHRNQVAEFVGTSATSTEDTSEDTPENSATPSAGEQCNGQCSNYPACPSGQTMNLCCVCISPETTPPNNGSNNGGGSADGGNAVVDSLAGDDSNPSSGTANQELSGNPAGDYSMPPSGSSGGGCSLNNNASFDPFLAVLFPIALLLLILRRSRFKLLRLLSSYLCFWPVIRDTASYMCRHITIFVGCFFCLVLIQTQAWSDDLSTIPKYDTEESKNQVVLPLPFNAGNQIISALTSASCSEGSFLKRLQVQFGYFKNKYEAMPHGFCEELVPFTCYPPSVEQEFHYVLHIIQKTCVTTAEETETTENFQEVINNGSRWEIASCPSGYVATGWSVAPVIFDNMALASGDNDDEKSRIFIDTLLPKKEFFVQGIRFFCQKLEKWGLDEQSEIIGNEIIMSDHPQQNEYQFRNRAVDPKVFPESKCSPGYAINRIDIGNNDDQSFHDGVKKDGIARLEGACSAVPVSEPASAPAPVTVNLKTGDPDNGSSFPDNPEGRGNKCTTKCDDGQILMGLRVRTGSLVDRIQAICFNQQDGFSPPPDDAPCGGTGGIETYLECNRGQYVRSWTMRTGRAADSIQIECADFKRGATTIEDLLLGEGFWTGEFGINAVARENNGYPKAPDKPTSKLLCEGNELPVGLDVWSQRFCWKSRGLIYDTEVCYDDIVSGARALCREASIESGTQTGNIDLSRLFHRDNEVQVEFIGTFATGSQDDPETSTEDTSEDAPENSATCSAGEQCNGQCLNCPACPSDQTMNRCCVCVDPETAPPINGSNNSGGSAGGGSGSPSRPANPVNSDSGENSIADSTPSGSSGGGCSLNNNASFDPSLAALFPIALLLLILRRRRLVCH